MRICAYSAEIRGEHCREALALGNQVVIAMLLMRTHRRRRRLARGGDTETWKVILERHIDGSAPARKGSRKRTSPNICDES